jgi:ribonuclease HI
VRWWIATIAANVPRRIAQTPPQAVLQTDASPLGWGAVVQLLKDKTTLWISGKWGKKARTSNAFECLAVLRTLYRLHQMHRCPDLSSVLVRSDNTTTCYNINRRAACESLAPLIHRLLRFADRHQIELTAEHIPGTQNIIPDRLSRISPQGDYALKQTILQQLLEQWQVQIDADLFAAPWSAKHPRYCSLIKDRGAMGRNAFHMNWAEFKLPLLHPPICLIPKVLKRLQQEKMQAILVIPAWDSQPWSQILEAMTKNTAILGKADEVLIKVLG